MFSCWMTPAGFGLASVVAEMMWSAFGLISDIAGLMLQIDLFLLNRYRLLLIFGGWLSHRCIQYCNEICNSVQKIKKHI